MNNPTFEYTNNESKCTLEDNGLTSNIIDDLICNPKFDNVKFITWDGNEFSNINEIPKDHKTHKNIIITKKIHNTHFDYTLEKNIKHSSSEEYIRIFLN